MYQQLHEHFNSTLSPKQYGFRQDNVGFDKGYSAQHCLMVILKNLKNRGKKEKNLGPFSLTFLKHLIP